MNPFFTSCLIMPYISLTPHAYICHSLNSCLHYAMHITLYRRHAFAFSCTHLHFIMHIDPACKELPTQKKPVIKEPDDRLYLEPEDEGSLIKSVPASRGCLGQSLTTRQTNVFSLLVFLRSTKGRQDHVIPSKHLMS